MNKGILFLLSVVALAAARSTLPAIHDDVLKQVNNYAVLRKRVGEMTNREVLRIVKKKLDQRLIQIPGVSSMLKGKREEPGGGYVPSGACNTSWVNYVTWAQTSEGQTCISFWDTIEDDEPSDSAASGIDDKVNQYCGAANCADMFRTHFGNLKDDCTGAPWDFFEKLIVLFKLPCTKHNGEFCFPQFLKFVNSLDRVDTMSDAEVKVALEAGCNDCTKKVFSLFNQFMDPDDVTFVDLMSILCMKRNGDFCILHFRDSEKEEEADDNDNLTEEDLEKICHPCTMAYLNKIVELATRGDDLTASEKRDIRSFFKIVTFLCQKRTLESGEEQWCMLLFEDLGDDTLNQCSGSSFTPPGSCPANCGKDIEKLDDKIGCCAGALFEFLGDLLGRSNNSISIDEFFELCGTEKIDSCSKAEWKAEIKGQIPNLSWQWCQDNLVQCKAAVRKALAAIFGWNEDDITDFSIAVGDIYEVTDRKRQDSHGTAFSGSAQADSPALISDAANVADENAAEGDSVLNQEVGPDGKNQLEEPYNTTVTDVEVTRTPSSAGALSGSLLLVGLSLLLSVVAMG